MRDQRAGLGANFAALNAEAPVNAMRAVAVRTGKNGDGAAGTYADAQLRAPSNQRVAHAAHGMRAVGIAVRIAPRIIGRAGHRHFQFQQLVIRFQLLISNRPVDADAVVGVNTKVRRMQTRRERRPMHGASADTLAAVVSAQARADCSRR